MTWTEQQAAHGLAPWAGPDHAVAAAIVGGRRVLRDAIAAAAGAPVVVLPRYVPDWQAA